MLLITEDWFLLSHFQPLVRALVAAFGDVVVVTTSSGRLLEIYVNGVWRVKLDRVIGSGADFDRVSFSVT